MLLYGLCSRPSAAADPAHTTSVSAQYEDNLLTYGTNTADGQVMLNPMEECSHFWFIIQQVLATYRAVLMCKKLSMWYA